MDLYHTHCGQGVTEQSHEHAGVFNGKAEWGNVVLACIVCVVEVEKSSTVQLAGKTCANQTVLMQLLSAYFDVKHQNKLREEVQTAGEPEPVCVHLIMELSGTPTVKCQSSAQ